MAYESIKQLLTAEQRQQFDYAVHSKDEDTVINLFLVACGKTEDECVTIKMEIDEIKKGISNPRESPEINLSNKFFSVVPMALRSALSSENMSYLAAFVVQCWWSFEQQLQGDQQQSQSDHLFETAPFESVPPADQQPSVAIESTALVEAFAATLTMEENQAIAEAPDVTSMITTLCHAGDRMRFVEHNPCYYRAFEQERVKSSRKEEDLLAIMRDSIYAQRRIASTPVITYENNQFKVTFYNGFVNQNQEYKLEQVFTCTAPDFDAMQFMIDWTQGADSPYSQHWRDFCVEHRNSVDQKMSSLSVDDRQTVGQCLFLKEAAQRLQSQDMFGLKQPIEQLQSMLLQDPVVTQAIKTFCQQHKTASQEAMLSVVRSEDSHAFSVSRFESEKRQNAITLCQELANLKLITLPEKLLTVDANALTPAQRRTFDDTLDVYINRAHEALNQLDANSEQYKTCNAFMQAFREKEQQIRLEEFNEDHNVSPSPYITMARKACNTEERLVNLTAHVSSLRSMSRDLSARSSEVESLPQVLTDVFIQAYDDDLPTFNEALRRIAEAQYARDREYDEAHALFEVCQAQIDLLPEVTPAFQEQWSNIDQCMAAWSTLAPSDKVLLRQLLEKTAAGLQEIDISTGLPPANKEQYERLGETYRASSHNPPEAMQGSSTNPFSGGPMHSSLDAGEDARTLHAGGGDSFETSMGPVSFHAARNVDPEMARISALSPKDFLKAFREETLLSSVPMEHEQSAAHQKTLLTYQDSAYQRAKQDVTHMTPSEIEAIKTCITRCLQSDTRAWPSVQGLGHAAQIVYVLCLVGRSLEGYFETIGEILALDQVLENRKTANQEAEVVFKNDTDLPSFQPHQLESTARFKEEPVSAERQMQPSAGDEEETEDSGWLLVESSRKKEEADDDKSVDMPSEASTRLSDDEASLLPLPERIQTLITDNDNMIQLRQARRCLIDHDSTQLNNIWPDLRLALSHPSHADREAMQEEESLVARPKTLSKQVQKAITVRLNNLVQEQPRPDLEALQRDLVAIKKCRKVAANIPTLKVSVFGGVALQALQDQLNDHKLSFDTQSAEDLNEMSTKLLTINRYVDAIHEQMQINLYAIEEQLQWFEYQKESNSEISQAYEKERGKVEAVLKDLEIIRTMLHGEPQALMDQDAEHLAGQAFPPVAEGEEDEQVSEVVPRTVSIQQGLLAALDASAKKIDQDPESTPSVTAQATVSMPPPSPTEQDQQAGVFKEALVARAIEQAKKMIASADNKRPIIIETNQAEETRFLMAALLALGSKRAENPITPDQVQATVCPEVTPASIGVGKVFHERFYRGFIQQPLVRDACAEMEKSEKQVARFKKSVQALEEGMQSVFKQMPQRGEEVKRHRPQDPSSSS